MKKAEERYKPKINSENLIESLFHLHRYLIASKFVKNKIVLDIACGEGYGTFILSKKAKKIWGADIDKNTIEQARKKYQNKKINFIQANATDLPFEKNFFDVIVSFETIEHLSKENGIKFLTQIKKTLKKGGTLILSTPNKERTLFSSYKNVFHLYEYYQDELVDMLKKYFDNVVVYDQDVNLFSLIFNKNTKKTPLFNLELENERNILFTTKKQIKLPLYKIYICANKKIKINFDSVCQDISRFFLNNFYHELNFYKILLSKSEEEIEKLKYEIKKIQNEKRKVEKVINNIVNARWFKLSYFLYQKIKKFIFFKL